MVKAYDDGQLVGTARLQAATSVKAVGDFLAGTATGVDSAAFTGRFTSVDKIAIDGAGGTDSRSHVGTDGLVLQYVSGAQADRIDLPDGMDVAALLATAVTDGAGGSVLTHEAGTLRLVGIAPAELSADWFA